MGTSWKIADAVRMDLVKALTSGRKPRYVAEKKITRRQTSFWLSFDGIEFDPKANKVRLLYGNKTVAEMDIPPMYSGDKLTIRGLPNGSFEGRTAITLTTS